MSGASTSSVAAGHSPFRSPWVGVPFWDLVADSVLGKPVRAPAGAAAHEGVTEALRSGLPELWGSARSPQEFVLAPLQVGAPRCEEPRQGCSARERHKASDKPSDNDPRQWQTERDVLRHRNPSDLR